MVDGSSGGVADAPAGGPLLVDAVGLGKHFTLPSEVIHAVRGVDLAVKPGEFVCLMGESGSGKSSLLNLLSGLELPSTGRLSVCGNDISGMSESSRAALRLSHVGVVFQRDNLLDEFTALENVLLPLEVAGWSRAQSREEAQSALALVGVEHLASRFPEQMSGGQRQRVGIARAIVGGRQLLLADEPTGALDSHNSLSLFRLLRRVSDSGTSVIVATHETRCRDFADRCLVMCDGEFAEAG